MLVCHIYVLSVPVIECTLHRAKLLCGLQLQLLCKQILQKSTGKVGLMIDSMM